MIAKKQYQEAVVYFCNAVPLTVGTHYNNDYYKLVTHYQQAMILSSLGKYSEAAQCMNETGAMSAGDRQDHLFSDHQAHALSLRAKQMTAIEAGKPGFLITALPRSASAFLSYAIADILDVPVLRASMGSFPHHTVVKNWAYNIGQGGCVTHDHFCGMEINIRQLIEAGIKKVYVQVRDPRAAAWSYLHHTAPSYRQQKQEVIIDDIIHREYYPHAIRWIESWIKAQEKYSDDIAVEFLLYDEVVCYTEKILLRLLTPQHYPEISEYLKKTSAPDFKPIHFRKGQKGEWREFIPKELQDVMWNMTSERVRNLLKMER